MTEPKKGRNYFGAPLGEILQSQFGVPKASIEQALLTQTKTGARLGEILVASKSVTHSQLAQAFAAQMDLPFRNEVNVDGINHELLNDLPISFAKQNKILPIGTNPNGSITLVCYDAIDFETHDELRLLFQKEIELEIAPPDVISSAINRAYDKFIRHAESAVADLVEIEGSNLKGDLEEEVVDLLDIEGDDEAPIIRLVNSLLTQAVKDRASDIHIEPYERDMVVRFRVDGVLYEIIKPPKRFQNSVLSRVKIMAGLNIAEKRLPQDGRIRLKVAGRDIDIRVSTIPTGYGERIVMRLLDRSNVMKDLSEVGFSDRNLAIMNKLITASHGIILVSGPTGSGKTSTLYASLSKINKPDLNILTIEDPVEYQLAGVSQVQVNPKIDLTFASGLRAFLRQDPDVIMVGEIRDRETAEIAIQASLTGHLVFSTVHTNDAPGAVTRLVDMHVEPFLIASSLMAVLAQRLVRTICPGCKEAFVPTKEELAEIGLSTRSVKVLYKGKGCDQCQKTGYLGRIGIFEMMIVDDEIRQLILKNADSVTLKAKARTLGMVTLREDGAEKVQQGLTTIEEVTRVTRDDAMTVDIG